jgi:hypothetical protein
MQALRYCRKFMSDNPGERLSAKETAACEILKAVRENVDYPIDQCHMILFIFSDFAEAVTYILIGQARIL